MSDQPPPPWRGPEQPRWQGAPPPQAPWQQPPPTSHGWQGPVPGGPPYGWAPPPQRSRTPVIAVVVLIVIVLAVVGVLAYIGSTLAPLVGRTPLPDLTVGQCFNGGRAPSGTGTHIVFGVDVVECNEPHESELMATFDYPESGTGLAYPGDETVSDYAEGECAERFAEYVGLSFSSSFLEMSFLYPLRQNWTAGDYSIQCVVHPPVGQQSSTGSYRGSRR